MVSREKSEIVASGKGYVTMRLLTLVQVASMLGISYTTAHKIRHRLPGSVWLGTRRRWREGEIARLIEGASPDGSVV